MLFVGILKQMIRVMFHRIPSESQRRAPCLPGSGSVSRSITPVHSTCPPTQSHTGEVGEQLLTDFKVHEIPTTENPPSTSQLTSSESQLINRALLARVELLEAENKQLKKALNEKKLFPTRRHST